MKFYMPTKLITGAGSVAQSAERIGALGRRCLIVTGKSSAKKCGALDDVTAALDAQGIAWQVYDGVRQNPTLESCAEGGAAARAFGADFLVGVGGARRWTPPRPSPSSRRIRDFPRPTSTRSAGRILR